MGRGQRHSKNAGVMGSESLTYAEKRALGFGTVRERLGKDSVGNFDDCRLTLRPVVDPVCTPEGFLFSREALIENLVQQKKMIKRKLAAWEAANAAAQQKSAELAAAEGEARLLAFDRQNHMGASEALTVNIQRAIKASAEEQLADKKVVASVHNIREQEERLAQMKAFWLPQKTPEAAALPDKPNTATLCPASGKRLRLKDLIQVKFTRVPEVEGGGDTGRYMDPVTKDTLGNSDRLVVLKPTGDVVRHDTYEKLIKPDGAYNGVKIREKDVVELQRGGTGFAAVDGEKAQVSKHWHLGPGSGLADLRGQHQGPRSATGLTFWN